MTDYDITQISVGGQRIGIIGLKPVLETVARDFAGRFDELHRVQGQGYL
jgi:hypothetical protein